MGKNVIGVAFSVGFTLTLVACGAGESSPGAAEHVGRSANRLASYAAYVTGLAPVGWWRLGENNGATEALDLSGKGHHGAYVNAPALAQIGAINADANSAMSVASASGQYVEIPDHDDFSLVKVADSFQRTVSTGSSWGATQGWSAAFSSGAFYSCDGTSALINETGAAATWGQLQNVGRKDVDVRVLGKWSELAAGGVLSPLALVARYADSSNHYRAELRQNPDAAHTLDLRLSKVVGGVYSTIDTLVGIGQGTVNQPWYLRFQVETDACDGATTLRARAWPASQSLEPSTWLSANDSSLTTAGAVGVRSSNSGTTTRPTVSVSDFRVQSVGMTVHVWMKPSATSFGGESNAPDQYVHWLGKGQKVSGNSQMEWGFRFYDRTDRPDGTSLSERPNRISAYAWTLSGDLGSGAYFQPASRLPTTDWINIVAVYDPGDKLDASAGVAIYKNGALSSPSGQPPSRYAAYGVVPANGTAPLRIGTRGAQNSTTPSYFDGALDEVQIYDRRLCPADIAGLYENAHD